MMHLSRLPLATLQALLADHESRSRSAQVAIEARASPYQIDTHRAAIALAATGAQMIQDEIRRRKDSR